MAKLLWRPLLRALHRDIGYLGVGLTLVYALSGLAVNHIGQWDPNFRTYDRTVELGPITGASGAGAAADDDAVARAVAARLGIDEAPKEVYRAGEHELDILYAHRTVHVDPATGHVQEEGQDPRFFLRAANWLHLNRGKKAWTYAADAYALALVVLATSGLFMIKGRKGLAGRGLLLAVIGAAVPIAYVTLSGGP